MKKKILFSTLMIFASTALFPGGISGGNIPDGLSVKLRAGYSVGGTAPLDMPPAIRSIDSYNLTPSIMFGVDAECQVYRKWGLQTGLHIENKGMDASITTKGYRMEMMQEDSRIEGLFTGTVHQKVTSWMLTLPVQATLNINRISLKAGPYASFVISGDFSGIASNGYLRQGDPTGPKIIIGNRDGEWATYDFSEHIRSFQFGVNIGSDYTITDNFGVSADLNWGLTGFLKNSFKTVDRALYPIYGTIGLFYRF